MGQQVWLFNPVCTNGIFFHTDWFKHILFVYFVHRTTYKDIQ